MSCCNRRHQKIIVQCGETQEAETYTFSNANVTGQGVFISETDNSVTFKGIASSGGTITITNDAPNNTVNLEINESAIPALVPQASETVQGKIELATSAEVITGTDTTRAVTAAGLASLTSTTLRAGLVRIATNGETLAGALTNVAVSPAGLAYYESFLKHPVTFANAAARSVTVPSYIGQLGVQQDTGAPYLSYNTTAGSWEQVFIYSGGTTSLGATTTLNADLANLVIQDVTDSGGGLVMSTGGTLTIGSTGNLNFLSSGRLKIDGTNVPAYAVPTISGTAGQLTYYPSTDFLWTNSVIEEWTIDAYVTNRTFDPATITLPQLAAVVATLIQDTANLRKPVIVV